MNLSPRGMYFEEFEVGLEIQTAARTITETDMVKAIPDEVKQKILKTIPLRRFATEREIAWGVAFLMSPEASGYITGATLSINGGRRT